MLIRGLREADIPQVLDTLGPYAGQAYPGGRQFLHEALLDAAAGCGLAALVYDPEGQLTGLALALSTDRDGFELAALWTDPAFRRRGLARAALSTFGPAWGSTPISVTLGADTELGPVCALLDELAFRPRPAGQLRIWTTRRIRRTRGRASVVPARG